MVPRFPFLIFAIVVLIVTVGLFISLDTPWAKDQMEKAVRESFAGCVFEMESVSLTWRGLIVKDVRFARGRSGAQKLEAHIARIVIHPEFRPLLKKEIRIRSLVLFSPRITYSEGDAAPAPARDNDDRNEFRFALERVNVYDGKFIYVRDHQGTHGVLGVNEIRGKIRLEDERIKFDLHARLGHSGKFELSGQAGLKKPLDVDTELHVRDQDLADLTVFLKPNAGVELNGRIIEAAAKSRARGEQLNTRLNITFRDFNLKLDEMYDRSEVSAFFTTLGAALVLKKDNVGEPAPERSSTVDTRREKGESIVHFLLTGLKEASLEAAK